MVPFVPMFGQGLPHLSITTSNTTALSSSLTTASASTSSTRSRRSRFLRLHRRSSNSTSSTSENSSSSSHEVGSVQGSVRRSMRVKIRDIFGGGRATEEGLGDVGKAESRRSSTGGRGNGSARNTGRKASQGGSGWVSLSGYDTEDETEEQEIILEYERMRREEAVCEEAHWSLVWASAI